MLDNQEEIWLWQGWWPDKVTDENLSTGSSKLRWAAERRYAFETVLHYCQLKKETNPPEAYFISAGLESLAFTCLFPEWVPNDDIAQISIMVSIPVKLIFTFLFV